MPLPWKKVLGGVAGAYLASLLYRGLDPSPRIPRTRASGESSEGEIEGVEGVGDPQFVPRSTAARRVVFERLAPGYDRFVSVSEAGAIQVHRRLLCGRARGRVLEVGVGTARNLTCFPTSGAGAVTEVLGIDSSEAMLRVAQAKYDAARELAQAQAQAALTSGSNQAAPPIARPLPPMRFALGDIESGCAQLPARSFDTVLATFALCSCADPAAALREMARLVKPGRQGGRILLLEHGRAHGSVFAPLLNPLLRWRADQHARRWGCDLDRDVPALLAESGLRVLEQRVAKMGTVGMYVLAGPDEPGSAELELEPAAKTLSRRS